jgi:RNA polymerase sigma-70 factor (ECF subfamily)
MTSAARVRYTTGLSNESLSASESPTASESLTASKSLTDHAQEHTLRDGVDRRLVQRCATQDSAALQEIVERYQSRLLRFLNRLLGSREDAEEAALDVFLRVWQQAHRFEGRASFATWLYRIASNVACDQQRRKTSQRRTESLEENTVGDRIFLESVSIEEAVLNRLEQEERLKQVQKALQTLRVEDRLLLVLYYSEELGYEEISQITKHSYPILKMRLMRARRRLRTVLEESA